MKPQVTIYGKPECCLCDQALEVLEAVRKRIPFDIDKRDISGDADLVERYGFDIPVIFVDGKLAFKHRIDKERLIALLKGK
ncbi:glutaredoxin family protein [Chlorobaculum sp. MV4-Y]|uniref:glutaredoxin family protein n=1 Tax=Chlorobaculum sp. MV4-Y TaxID=2976335 RepID=UPI0021AFA63D|nr:glutaredoxin family protein [Chlorobaculum sp. MV4-Y]UWX57878.1 glutaredoxin family protein [Chlorobaculum sp. MV4-Y]